MSEFLATASVLIRPDTTGFATALRLQLEKAVAEASRGLTAPVSIAATGAGAGVLAGATGETQALTAAQTELAAELQAQGIAAANAAKETAALAAAQGAALKEATALARVEATTGAVQTRLAAASKAGALATTELAGARAVLSETSAAVALAERNVAASLALSSASAQENAAAVLADARAKDLNARSAVREAIAQRQSAKVAADSAAAHELAARGAAATSLSLLGIRGATLAASAPFLAGAAAVTVLAKSVKEASAEEEAFARVQAVLGEALANQSEEWARQQAAIGLSTTAALRAQGALAEVLHNVGLTTPRVAELSQQFVELAPNVAAFANVDVETILRAIQLGISGNLRALRPYIGALRQADIVQDALARSGKKTSSELTNQELVLARARAILEKTANQAKAAEDRQAGFAGQTRKLKADLANLGAELGSTTLPLMEGFAAEADLIAIGLGKVARGFNTADKEVRDFFGTAKDAAAGLLGIDHEAKKLPPDLQKVVDQLDKVRGKITPELRDALIAGADAAGVFRGALLGAAGATGQLVTTAALAKQALGEIAASEERLTQLDIVGASPEQRIAELQRKIKAAQDIVKKPPTVSARRRAREEIDEAIREIRSIQEEEQRKRQQAVDDARRAAEEAARKAQEARDKADQAFIDALSFRRGALDIKAIRAERTKGIQDDIAVQREIIALSNQRLAVVRQQINDSVLEAKTIQDLKSARETAINAIADLRAQEKQEAEERAKERREHAELLRERADQRADLAIEIAQTRGQIAEATKNVTATNAAHRAEIAARNAKIKLDEQRLANVHGDLVRAAQLRLDILRQKLAIKELKKQSDERNDAARSLAFSFLQAQQGFAANLLSNLVPVGAIRGTVGAGAGGQPSPALGPAAALSTSAQVAGAGGGATRTQAAAMIDLLRNILVSLTGHTTVRQQPEAVMQMMWQSTEMAHL